MKFNKILSILFAVIAVALIALTAFGYAAFHDEPPMIKTSTDIAEAKTITLMEAICHGDYAAASAVLYGNPTIEWSWDTASNLSTTLWTAYADSISYEFDGSSYTTESGIFRDVTITAMDVAALGPKIYERFQQLSDPYVTAATRDHEIYDEDGNLRQEFTEKLLYQAIDEILAEDNATVSYQITLELVFQDGQWWVVPSKSLIDIVAGVMVP